MPFGRASDSELFWTTSFLVILIVAFIVSLQLNLNCQITLRVTEISISDKHSIRESRLNGEKRECRKEWGLVLALARVPSPLIWSTKWKCILTLLAIYQTLSPAIFSPFSHPKMPSSQAFLSSRWRLLWTLVPILDLDEFKLVRNEKNF